MFYRKLVLDFHQLVFDRIHLWLLPWVILIQLLSGAALKWPLAFDFISVLTAGTIHSLFGVLMALIATVLIYDALAFKRQGKLNPFITTIKKPRLKIFSYDKAVKTAFYALMGMMILTGTMLYLALNTWASSWLPNVVVAVLWHELIAWSFIALMMVKYYLEFVDWFRQLKAYLREY